METLAFWPTVKHAGGGSLHQQTFCARLTQIGFLAACIFFCVGLVTECDAVTKSGDIQGLMAVKLAIENHDNDFMLSWDDAVDPCIGTWRGVTCNCTTAQKEKPGTPLDCETVEETLEQRVISLELGCKQCRTDAYKLNGTIAPELSRLEQLRYLDLSMNNLEGPLPNSLQELKELRFLSVSDNKLSGTLPSFIGDLVHLRELQLDSNYFGGSIPQDWCTPDFNVSKVIVHNNRGLCGTVPTCLQDEEVEEENRKIPLIESTFLRRSSADSAGVCDSSPPECPEIGCRIGVPKYWTLFEKVLFYYYDLMDPESDVAEYFFELRKDGSDEPITSAPIQPSDDMIVTKVVSQRKNDSLQANRTYVDFNISGFSLSQGANYSVTIIAQNGAGPPLTTNFTSDLVMVDYTAPEGGALRVDLAPSEDANLTLSWTSLRDDESQVSDVSLQLQKMTEDGHIVNVTGRLGVSPSQNTSEIDEVLEEDTVYKAILYASNGAGLGTSTISDTFRVEEDGESSKSRSVKDWIIASIVCLVVGSVAMGISVVHIGKARRKLSKNYPNSLKDFMNSLLETGCDQPIHRPVVVNEHREVAFVVTDLEGSTEMSNYSEIGFKVMTVIHNEIMRAGIAAHAGYEINTEGDSFLVAFTSVVDAVLFCMETQYSLLDAKWPYDVLKLPKCLVEKTVDNEVIFRGPRVRMAIHWADEIVNRLHPNTRCRVFEGPGFELAKEIADAANGGQVLLTHQAWLKLQDKLGIAGFPTIEQIGEFSVDQLAGLHETTIWLYQVTQLIGRPLQRTFLPPRRLAQVNEGWGFRIIKPPSPPSEGYLAFVAIRAVFPEDIKEFHPDVADLLFKDLASLAQPFQGYIYSGNKLKGRTLLAFAKTSAAVRYSHAVQVSLLHTRWPDGVEQYAGPTEFGPSGYPLFQGPRLAIAIHHSRNYATHSRRDVGPNQSQLQYYDGPGHMFVKELSKVASGGQVVLSEPAWSSIQQSLPQTQTISLGKHILGHGFRTPQLLMEVLPEILKDREFEDLATETKLEPGYQDSPSVSQNIAIVFVKAIIPKDVQNAEQRNGTGSSTDHQRKSQVLTDYYTSMEIFSHLVRKWLPKYNGYECKEPKRGMLTLAFWDVDQAIRWCAHVQLELLQQEWPAGLLNMDGCGEVYADTGELLRKGLRVKMGMAYGLPGMKKPLSSGRADYFGNLPNLAARVSGLAAPGQILVECSPGFGKKVSWLQEGSQGLISFESAEDEKSVGNAMGAIELRELGYYYLKGFDDNLKLIYQALPLSLLKREYEMEPSAIRVADKGRLVALRSEPLRFAIKKKRDLFSRLRVGWLMGYVGSFVGVDSFGTKTSIQSSPIERDSSSILASNSHQNLYPSPRMHSGSPVRKFDLAQIGRNGTSGLVPSPGPSQTNLDEISSETHGSWGDSTYRCHSRSGSSMSVLSRGQSSTLRSPPDASPSPPLIETPFCGPPDSIVLNDDEPSTSLSLRNIQGTDPVLSCRDSLREWESMPGSLVQRDSNDSAKAEKNYIKNLVNLYLKRPDARDMDADSSGANSDIESQVDVQGLRAASAPEFWSEGWHSGLGDEHGGLHMSEDYRRHIAAQRSRHGEAVVSESDERPQCRNEQV